MKTHLFAVLALGTCSLAFNAEARSSRLSCPSGSEPVLFCTDGTQRGDHEVAIAYMDEAMVCQTGSRFAMLLDGDNMQAPMGPIPVTRTIRPGATTFSVKSKEITFVLSRMIVSPSIRVNGRFTISTQGITAGRSLICN